MKEQYIVDEKGRRTAVVLSVKDYERLLEDMHDLAVVARRRSDERVSLEEVIERLKADGLLED